MLKGKENDKTKWFQSVELIFFAAFHGHARILSFTRWILRHIRHLYLELLHLKPEVNITLKRVTFHCHKRSELATAAGIEKRLT